MTMLNLQEYIKQSTLFKTHEIGDLMLVEYRCLVKDHQSDIWTHHDYFAYVLGGEKKWETPTNSIKVGSGEVLYVRKGATSVYQYFEQPFFVIFIFISDDFIRKVLSKHPGIIPRNAFDYLDNNHLVLLEANAVLKTYFDSLQVYFSHHVTLQDAVLKLKIEELILDILTQPGNSALKHHFANLADRRKYLLAELMHANYLKPLAIRDYARMSGRSLSSFRRDFLKEFGTTPGKWLLQKRLEHCRFLLDTTDNRIGDVLYASGFGNRAHFNKAFRNRYGCSPNHYRKHPFLREMAK